MLAFLSVLHVFLLWSWHLFWVLQQQKVIPEGKTLVFGWEAESVIF